MDDKLDRYYAEWRMSEAEARRVEVDEIDEEDLIAAANFYDRLREGTAYES